MLTSTPVVPTAELPDILVVDVDAETYAGVLGRSFRVVTVNRTAAAFEQLAQRVPSAIVADLDRVEGSVLDLIARARGFSGPPAILVTTAEPERVPDAIGAGCDSVLLKPFPPNLICSRLGRLVRSRHVSLRQQSVYLRERAARAGAKSVHLHERGDLITAGSMRDWPTTHCPYCGHAGVTGFEYASHRRAWYACMSCKKVWMAKRQD